MGKGSGTGSQGEVGVEKGSRTWPQGEMSVGNGSRTRLLVGVGSGSRSLVEVRVAGISISGRGKWKLGRQ